MEFGIFHEFLTTQTGSQAEAFAQSAEINPGSLLNHEQVMNSLRLYCQEVMPQFR